MPKNVISPTCRCFALYIEKFQNEDFDMWFLLKSQNLENLELALESVIKCYN